jgi:hypothetical protein
LAAKSIDRAFFWLVVPIIAALISIGRIWSVLPAVMQDEYVYSIQARFTPFADQLYPNYLFSWLYSTTSACGTGFYGCGKGLNVIFFLATLAFIFLIARRLLSVTWAAMISTVAALSPIHVYVIFHARNHVLCFHHRNNLCRADCGLQAQDDLVGGHGGTSRTECLGKASFFVHSACIPSVCLHSYSKERGRKCGQGPDWQPGAAWGICHG